MTTWTGLFLRNSSDFFRSLEGYFLVTEAGTTGFTRPITVVSATSTQIVLRDSGFLGELTFNGQGLSVSQPGQVTLNGISFPQLLSGTITSISGRFNVELDSLITALALATTAQQRNAIQAQINVVLTETTTQLATEAAGGTPAVSHLIPNAFVTVPNISAAQLGTAAVQSFQTGTVRPMQDFLNQFTVDFTGPGAPGGLLGQGFDLFGFENADRLTGGTGNDRFVGNGGNDVMNGGGNGVDIYDGGEGSDLYILGAGRDAVTDTGTRGGLDIVSYQNAPGSVQVVMDQQATFPGVGWANQDTFGGIEGIIGSNFDDWLIGRSIVQGDLSADFLVGGAGNDRLTGGEGADTLEGGAGDDLLEGGGNADQLGNPGRGDIAVYTAGPQDVHFFADGFNLQVITPREGVDTLNGVELISLGGQVFSLATQITLSNANRVLGSDQSGAANGGNGIDLMFGRGGNDTLNAFGGNDILNGGEGNDSLDGGDGADTISGGNGVDTLIGGSGNDQIFGGDTMQDLRDVVFGGAGNDTIDGGYGNDELRGDAGNDDIAGGFGADTVIGGGGNDTLTGSAFGDLIFGGDGFDFINGGFGSDRVNGGANGDRFFHLGLADHGSDWIQDYNATEGDVLVYGGSATRSQFQVNVTNTANAGADGVDEAFIIYRPTGQILWALVDGDGQASINIRIGGQEFDLLA